MRSGIRSTPEGRWVLPRVRQVATLLGTSAKQGINQRPTLSSFPTKVQESACQQEELQAPRPKPAQFWLPRQ